MFSKNLSTRVLSALIPRPFDDEDTGDGTGGGQDPNASPGETGEKTSIIDELKNLLDERLAPINQFMDSSKNFQNQTRRHLNLDRNKSSEGSDSEGGEGNGSKDLTDAQKRQKATEDKIAGMEKREAEGGKRLAITDGLSALDSSKLVAGATDVIRDLVSGRAVYDPIDGKTYYDDGQTQIPIAEAIANEAKKPMFLRSIGREGGGGPDGEPNRPKNSTAKGFGDYTEEELGRLSRKDFNALRTKRK